MYTVSASVDLVARHFLTVPNCGPENDLHAHRYGVDVRLSGPELDERGYLVDVDNLRSELNRIESRYRDETLNDLPAFEGLNPSVEHFARIVCESLVEALDVTRLDRVAVRIHEDDVAWASYAHEL